MSPLPSCIHVLDMYSDKSTGRKVADPYSRMGIDCAVPGWSSADPPSSSAAGAASGSSLPRPIPQRGALRPLLGDDSTTQALEILKRNVLKE